MNRILIIAAHPDDDILGCGGFMSKYSKQNSIRVAFIAEGSSCRFDGNSDEIIKEEIDKRNQFGLNALKVLGVKNVEFYNHKCGNLDQVSILKINKIIENEINNFKPNVLFTHSSKDANNDHSIVHKYTIMATRPGAKFFVPKVYAYEVLSSSEWKFTESFKPNFFEQLNEKDLLNKWRALRKYESEIKPYPYPRSYEGLKVLSNFRGLQCNCEYAEAYEVIREINLL